MNLRLQRMFLKLAFLRPSTAAPRTIAGRTLDPRLAYIQDRAGERGPQSPPDVERLRHEFKDLCSLLGGPRQPDVLVQSFDIKHTHARLYRHKEEVPGTPPLLYLHQGGGVVGDLDVCDTFCTMLAAEGRGPVLSIKYRLAPEHRHPAALEDALDCYHWARERWGTPPAVGGDSAGGYLAAAACQELLRRGEPLPPFQLLIYPTVNIRDDSPSMEQFAHAFPLSRELLAFFIAQVVPPDAPEGPHPHENLLAQPLAGLPPALVYVAGFDVLHDQGEAYARALQAAGVQVAFRSFDSLCHGFTAFTGLIPAADVACREMAQATASMLAARRVAPAHPA